MEEVDLLGRPLHAQPSLASLLAWETSMSAYTFGEMLSDGASHAAAADAAAEERSTAETEDIMSAEEGDPNAESRPGAAEEGGPKKSLVLQLPRRALQQRRLVLQQQQLKKPMFAVCASTVGVNLSTHKTHET